MATRDYTSRRMAIVEAFVAKLQTIDGSGSFRTNLYGNVLPRLKFWDEIKDFPAVNVAPGSETRQYQGGGYKDRFLNMTVRLYVNAEDPQGELEKLIEDVETVLEDNSKVAYTDQDGNTQYTLQTTILSIDTDEGALEPLGVGEILCEVQY